MGEKKGAAEVRNGRLYKGDRNDGEASGARGLTEEGGEVRFGSAAPLAQLASALPLHGRGYWFDSNREQFGGGRLNLALAFPIE